MARYIDADKLIEHIKDLPTWRETLGIGWQSTKYPNGMFDCEDIINSIDNAPTADVAEVKHGYWKKSQFSGRSGFYSVRDVICSECGIYSTFLQHEIRPDYYCPHCGAKMDGGKEE